MEIQEESISWKNRLPPLEIRKEKEEAKEEPLTPGGRLFHQPHFNCYILAIMGSAKLIDVELVKVGLEATLIRHPRFSSLQVFENGEIEAKAKWVRTTVCLDDHIVVADVSSIDPDKGDKFVEDYISGLSTTNLDLSKPLWDFHILNIKTSETEAVAVLRCHHSLGDGISLMSLLFACMRKTADPDSLPTIPEIGARKERDNKTFLGMLWVGILWYFRVFINTIVDFFEFAATGWFLKDTDTAIKGKVGVEFNPKRFVHKTISFEDVKTVKLAMGATVNDVLLGIISAGLTRYLLRRQDCDGESGNGELTENIRVRSTVLVNIRKTPGIQVLADMMEGRKGAPRWGNWLGYIILRFPIVHHDDPLEYVRMGKKIVDRKKASHEALFTFWSAKFILKVFGIKSAAKVSHKTLSNTTFSFSNVMGPLEEVGFYGHPMVYLAPSVYGHPHALTIHFQSYIGKMKVVVAVDESVIPDPHQLCEDFATSLELMMAAVEKNAATMNIQN